VQQPFLLDKPGFEQHERTNPSAEWAALMAEENQNNTSQVRTSGQPSGRVARRCRRKAKSRYNPRSSLP
jgi:hypothetical protein